MFRERFRSRIIAQAVPVIARNLLRDVHAFDNGLAPVQRVNFFKHFQIACRQSIELHGRRRGVPVFAIVVEPEPDSCADGFCSLDALWEKLVVLVLRVLQKVQLRRVVQVCRLDRGVLQYDFVHPERVQALVHVRDGILRVVGGRPSGIEHARDSCGVRSNDSAQERGECMPKNVLRDSHT